MICSLFGPNSIRSFFSSCRVIRATDLTTSNANGVANGRLFSNANGVAIPTPSKGGGGSATPKDTKHGVSVASFAKAASSRHGEIFCKLEPPGYLDVADYNKFVIENAPFSMRNLSKE